MGAEPFTDREMLIRIEGKLERLDDKVTRSIRDHDKLSERVHGHSQRFQLHETRFSAIETKMASEDGERKGIAKATKIAYAMSGLFGGGTIFTILAAILKTRGI